MRLTLTCLLAAGCGSFGLDPAAAYSGELLAQPQGATEFGALLPDRQAAAERFVYSSADEGYGVDVLDVWLEGDTGAFALVVPSAMPRILESGEKMAVTVQFRPVEEGPFKAELVAETAAGDVTRRKLSGTGCKNRDGNQRCD